MPNNQKNQTNQAPQKQQNQHTQGGDQQPRRNAPDRSQDAGSLDKVGSTSDDDQRTQRQGQGQDKQGGMSDTGKNNR